MKTTTENNQKIWNLSTVTWSMIVSVGMLLIFLFYDGLELMVKKWNDSPEYGYGYMIPIITLFLIWQKKAILQKLRFRGTWAGIFIVFIGLGLFVVGKMSTLYILVQYSFLMVLIGMALAFMGWQAFKIILVPLLLLIFMVPMPNFVFVDLSSQLQLISSEIGVWVIRLFGISVFLEGNVIDLGVFKLQVVEACSGLRYLLPLMVLGFITAYFYKVAFWKRSLVFLSTIPITVLMNSFRIGIIGVMVEYWGQSMAEGFLHDFEGWVIFMASIGVLIVEMWALAQFGERGRSFQEVFGLELPETTSKSVSVQYRSVPKQFVAGLVLLVMVLILSLALPKRVEIQPQRKIFSSFPMSLGEWHGKADRLDQIYIDALNFDDYLIADFVSQNRFSVNLYIGYYGTQRSDKVPHSPRACLPGGGWEMNGLTQRNIKGAFVAGVPLRVNRTLIQKGEDRQLVYYWFQQRGRVITNEYLVKWYLFWDALTKNRSDGSLVRLVATLKPGQDIEEADRQLGAFAGAVTPQLNAYLPE